MISSSMKTTSILFVVLYCSMMASVVTGRNSVNNSAGGAGGGSRGTSGATNNNNNNNNNSGTTSYNNNQNFGNTLDNRVTDVTCDICVDSDITSASKSFTQASGTTWTCGYLQETVQDVNPASLYQSERYMCGQARLQAEAGGCCTQNNVSNVVTNINGACSLCYGRGGSVPSSKEGEAFNTGVIGTMNCGGLEDAMSQGIISASLCPRVQEAAGDFCCYSGVSGRTASLRGSVATDPLP